MEFACLTFWSLCHMLVRQVDTAGKSLTMSNLISSMSPQQLLIQIMGLRGVFNAAQDCKSSEGLIAN